MRIEYSQNAEEVRPLATAWLARCRAVEFGLKTDLEAILADLKQWLVLQTGVLILAYEDDVPVGGFAVFACQSYLSDEKIALEKYWFAEPNHQMVGPKLYLLARRWALASGCRHLLLSASHVAGPEHDKIVQFCRNAGMQPFETSFLERLE